MQVFQTAGVPHNTGRSIFATIGCTENNKPALTKMVIANRTVTAVVFDFISKPFDRITARLWGWI
jgi:hypothetical protein